MKKYLFRPTVIYYVNYYKRKFPKFWEKELVTATIKDNIEWILLSHNEYDCIPKGWRFVKSYVPEYTLWGIPDSHMLYSTDIRFTKENHLDIKYLAGHMDSKEFIEYVKQEIYEQATSK